MGGSYHTKVMKRVQGTLCIQDGTSDEINDQIVEFSKRTAHVLTQLFVSEPSLVLDMAQMGVKVPYNSYKHDSIDGFIKGQ